MPKPDLLGRRPVVQESSQESKEVVGRLLGGVSKRELRQIPLKRIRIEEQVRREFPEEAHRALMENIRAQGGVIEIVRGVQHEAAPGFDRAAIADANVFGGRTCRNIELRQQVREAERPHQPVDDQAHGPIGGVGTHVDDGAGEARVAHAGHRHQELAGDEAVVNNALAHDSHVISV